LASALRERKKHGRCGFIPFLTAGYPSLSKTAELLLSLERCGADAIELGIPFSEPVADGPVIAEACHRALKQGVTLEKALGMLSRVRRQGLKIPVIVFSYLNPVLNLGFRRFARLCKKSGAQAALVVDLPAEESRELSGELRREGLELVLLASPSTSKKRLGMIGRASGSIIYYVSRAGVTGARKGLAPGLLRRVAEVKRICKKPVIVGFGLSDRASAKSLSHVADGVVVGSALVSAAGGNGNAVGLVCALARRIVGGLSC
jgi:tryptophan synthase alpha chain